MSKDYVVVTTVQMFRHRYVVPIDKLQECNPETPVDPKWALDAVTMNDVNEFSQLHLGEQISDMTLMNEEEILDLFDSDNSYLQSWTKEYKLEWIDDCWEESHDETQERYHSYISRMYREIEKEEAENNIYTHGMSSPSEKDYDI